MAKFFYTCGSDPGYPYQNGWVEVHAKDRGEADKLFRIRFPDHEGIMNYAFCCSEEKWREMDPENTWGDYRCYEVIELTCTAPDNAPAKADKYLIEISERYSRQIVISDQPSAEAALALAKELYSYENGSIDQLGDRDFDGETSFEIVRGLSLGDPDYDEYAGYQHFNEEGEMP